MALCRHSPPPSLAVSPSGRLSNDQVCFRRSSYCHAVDTCDLSLRLLTPRDALPAVDVSKVDEVICGNVLGANLGQAPTRQASIGAGTTHLRPRCVVGLITSLYGAIVHLRSAMVLHRDHRQQGVLVRHEIDHVCGTGDSHRPIREDAHSLWC